MTRHFQNRDLDELNPALPFPPLSIEGTPFLAMSTEPQQQSGQQASQPPYNQYSLNYFQIVSFQLNVRLNCGVELPPAITVQQATIYFYQAMSQYGGFAQIGVMQVPMPAKDPSQPPKMVGKPVIVRQIVDRTPGANFKLTLAPPEVMTRKDGDSLSDLVRDNLYTQGTLQNSGPVRLFLYSSEENPTAQSPVSAMIINCNAALWDGVILKRVMQTFRSTIKRDIEKKTETPFPPPIFSTIGGWAKILLEAIQKKGNQSPLYLPIVEEGYSLTPISAILPKAESSEIELSDRRLTITLTKETVEECTTVLEDKHGPKAAKATTSFLSDLLMAAFRRALAEAFFRNCDETKVTLATAYQFDPRVVFDEISKDPKTYYLHAFAVLTVGRTIQRTEMEDDPKTWLLQETSAVAKDAEQRMDRGESMRQTLEIALGKMSEETKKNNAIAFELTDHGAFHDGTFEGGHRFDQCQLMSIGFHTESTAGVLRLEVQLGVGQDRDLTVVLLDRVMELCKGLVN